MKALPFVLLGLLITAQLAVPLRMIRDRENTLRNGELFRFITRPVDPADPFQGRYVRLGFQNNYIPCPEDVEIDLHRHEVIYALIDINEEGFAHFTSWSREKPADGHFLKTRYTGRRIEWNRETEKRIYKGLRLDLPFDRFYMEEAKAPRAEALARDAMRSGDCWAAVRILDGKAVIEDVFAQGERLRDLAAEKE